MELQCDSNNSKRKVSYNDSFSGLGERALALSGDGNLIENNKAITAARQLFVECLTIRQMNLSISSHRSGSTFFSHLNRSQQSIKLLLSLVLVLLYCSTLCLSAGSSDQVFADPSCSWSRDEPPSESERLLLIFKCDLQPLKGSFELLVSKFNGPKRLISQEDVQDLKPFLKLEDEKALQIYKEYVVLDLMIDSFYKDALKVINRKEFCTYPTVNRFKQLKSYVLDGSKLLADLYELMVIEYHTICLDQALKKLPKIPENVKQIVDIYVDGKNSNMLPDLNRPPGFNDEKKDEFSFDLTEAIAKNGPLEEVVDLIMDMGFSLSSTEDRVKKFKQDCKQFLIEIEERWQSMEMMSNLLSDQINEIQGFNNFVMRALIPTKYADVCSQLSNIY